MLLSSPKRVSSQLAAKIQKEVKTAFGYAIEAGFFKIQSFGRHEK